MTDHVSIELAAESELVHFVAASLQESVYEEIPAYSPRRAEDIAVQFATFREGRLPGNQLHWAIRDRDTDECLGSLQANFKPHQNIEIGYRVRSVHQGKGIATTALRQLLDELLSSMPNHQLLALVHPDNVASLRVLVKADFIAIEPQHEASCGIPDHRRCFQYCPPATSDAA